LYQIPETGKCSNYSDLAKDWRIWVFNPGKAKRMFSPPNTCRPVLGPPSLAGIMLALFLRVRRPEPESDRPPPPSSEIKNKKKLYLNFY
jgi:hypothetical protein